MVKLKSYRYAIPVLIITVLCVWAFLWWMRIFCEYRDHIMFFGFSATTASILVAVLQSIKTHDWNRRLAAKSALDQFREKTKQHLQVLDEAFNYYLRDENNIVTIGEIHENICKKNDNGAFLPCNVNHSKMMLDPDKKNIRESIYEYLNLYEGVASGVHQGVYDKEVVADLMAGSFIKVANLFGPYIIHFNEMYPSGKGRTWQNLKTLGEEFKQKYRDSNYAKKRDNAG
jgi:hypothetical protein